MGHIDLSGIRFELPAGRVLLDEVSFRVGEGAKVALVGANGSGSFDRFLIFGADGSVYESPDPVWDEGRVARAR